MPGTERVRFRRRGLFAATQSNKISRSSSIRTMSMIGSKPKAVTFRVRTYFCRPCLSRVRTRVPDKVTKTERRKIDRKMTSDVYKPKRSRSYPFRLLGGLLEKQTAAPSSLQTAPCCLASSLFHTVPAVRFRLPVMRHESVRAPSLCDTSK